jgi:hypothetical protein
LSLVAGGSKAKHAVESTGIIWNRALPSNNEVTQTKRGGVMNDYIFFMHNDAEDEEHNRDDEWAAYFAKLEQAGAFQGGSAIGDGVCVSKAGTPPEITPHLSGYIQVQAESLNRARELVQGNPVFEAGGTVEIRELPKS